MKRRSTIVCVSLAAACIASGAARASGFQILEQNASGLGNAYAGQAAAAENASTIFYNPAGMTFLPGRQVSGVVNVIGPTAKFSDNGGSRSPTGAPLPAAGDNGGNAGDWIPTGDLYASWQLSPKWWAGVGVTSPFGLETEYDSGFVGRYQSRRAQFKTIDLNPSIAYRMNDAVSVGAGLSYQHADFSVDRSYFAGAELPEAVRLGNTAWGWNAGVLITMSPQTRIGLSYRSTIDHDLTGMVKITGVGAASAIASARLPDTLSWAFSHQVNDRWQLLGDITYTHWGTTHNIPLVLTSTGIGASPPGTIADTLDLNFRNTYRVGVGANYKWSQAFTLKLGTAYDQTPVPDATHRTVFLPDGDRYWLSAGGSYRLSKATVLDFGYAHLFVPGADTLRNKGVGAVGAQGIVSGSYKSSVDIVSVQFTYRF